MGRLTIGLMSGTSLDGVDGVLLSVGHGPDDELVVPAPLPANEGNSRRLEVLARCSLPFDEALRAELLALNSSGGNELHRAALAANSMARRAAEVVQRILEQSGYRAAAVDAIGYHGQTVRHRPGQFDGCGYTLQLHNAALLAEITGIDVVCDFRSRDVAAGGQGAPLVPAFHADFFARTGHDVAVLNVGGMANLTLLHADGRVGGFDCGPGNVLMDLWAAEHLGQAFDGQGAWAASGQINRALLHRFMGEPYLQQAPPKSTGRDLFNRAWLDAMLALHAADHGVGLAAHDVQATLSEFTACAAIEPLRAHLPGCSELLVCGGGALNTHLMKRLALHLQAAADGSGSPRLMLTDARGLPAMDVEAAAFAWLASRFKQQRPGNRVEVTGARGPRILGALYPA